MLRNLVEFGSPFGAPLDFEGVIRLVFLDVFGATAKKKIMYLLTTAALKLEHAKQLTA